MIERLRKVIQKQEFFTKKDLLLVGVSGGVDSMVLCQLLFEENCSFIIAHCNYHLREGDSDLDEQFISNWAKDHGIAVHIKSFHLSKKKNVQEEARKLRYDFFDEIKLKMHCKYILTAHHSNDQVETFFLNLSRGAGLKGLKGMEEHHGDIVRPLLNISKAEIHDFAIKNNVPFRTDQSNSNIHYLRNFFRNEILPLIDKRMPSFMLMNLRSIDHLKEANLFVETIFREWKEENIESTTQGIKIVKPEMDKFLMISKLLVEYGFHAETISKVKKNYHQSGKRFTDKNGHELWIDRQNLFLQTVQSDKVNQEYTIDGPEGEIKINDVHFRWKKESMQGNLFKRPLSMDEVYLDFNQLRFPLSLRKWLPGDTIKPIGMMGKTKKIQDVFTNHKIPNFEKDSIYILFSGEDALWIPGIIRSEIAKISDATTSCIHITQWSSVKQ